MARSVWKPEAVSFSAFRIINLFKHRVHFMYRKKKLSLKYRFKRFYVYAVLHKKLKKNLLRCDYVQYASESTTPTSYSTFLKYCLWKNIKRRTGIAVTKMRGSANFVLKARPRDSIIHCYTYFNILLKLKGGYKLKIRKKFKQKKTLVKLFNINRYFTDRKFGEFIITRTSGGYRCNKDKAKIKKLKKDIAKARKRKLHQIRENARIWKKVLEASENKKGKGKGKGKATKKGKTAGKK